MSTTGIPTGRFVKVHSIRVNKNGTIDVVRSGTKRNPAKKKRKAKRKTVTRKRATKRKTAKKKTARRRR